MRSPAQETGEVHNPAAPMPVPARNTLRSMMRLLLGSFVSSEGALQRVGDSYIVRLSWNLQQRSLDSTKMSRHNCPCIRCQPILQLHRFSSRKSCAMCLSSAPCTKASIHLASHSRSLHSTLLSGRRVRCRIRVSHKQNSFYFIYKWA